MPSPSSSLTLPMADFSSVPVVEVDKFNIDKHMDGMTRAVQQVSFLLPSYLVIQNQNHLNPNQQGLLPGGGL